ILENSNLVLRNHEQASVSALSFNAEGRAHTIQVIKLAWPGLVFSNNLIPPSMVDCMLTLSQNGETVMINERGNVHYQERSGGIRYKTYYNSDTAYILPRSNPVHVTPTAPVVDDAQTQTQAPAKPLQSKGAAKAKSPSQSSLPANSANRQTPTQPPSKPIRKNTPSKKPSSSPTAKQNSDPQKGIRFVNGGTEETGGSNAKGGSKELPEWQMKIGVESSTTPNPQPTPPLQSKEEEEFGKEKTTVNTKQQAKQENLSVTQQQSARPKADTNKPSVSTPPPLPMQDTVEAEPVFAQRGDVKASPEESEVPSVAAQSNVPHRVKQAIKNIDGNSLACIYMIMKTINKRGRFNTNDLFFLGTNKHLFCNLDWLLYLTTEQGASISDTEDLKTLITGQPGSAFLKTSPLSSNLPSDDFVMLADDGRAIIKYVYDLKDGGAHIKSSIKGKFTFFENASTTTPRHTINTHHFTMAHALPQAMTNKMIRSELGNLLSLLKEDEI
ncbi:hypothetical protein, partial [Enterovibrio norvegicus]|uniref:hypothetical protein n=1 Tax=Enterovibrio norvegicus TaxID=188144 RepID=UPI00352E0D12